MDQDLGDLCADEIVCVLEFADIVTVGNLRKLSVGYREITIWFLSNSEKKLELFWDGVKARQVSVVRQLLLWRDSDGRNRIDPRVDDNFALTYACSHGFVEIVEMLLNWRGPEDSLTLLRPWIDPTSVDVSADPIWNTHPGSPRRFRYPREIDDSLKFTKDLITISAIGGSFKMVQMLVTWIGPGNTKFDARLHRLIHFEIGAKITFLLVDWWIKAHEYPSVDDLANYVYLHAIENGYTLVIEKLLGWYGPTDRYSESWIAPNWGGAFTLAIKYGQLDVVQILAEWRHYFGPGEELSIHDREICDDIDITIQDIRNSTEYSHIEILRFLVKYCIENDKKFGKCYVIVPDLTWDNNPDIIANLEKLGIDVYYPRISGS